MQPLGRHTHLTKRQLKHGLSILIQQHLVYFTESSNSTFYEANLDAAYGLIRTGKILEVVTSRHGTVARDLVHNLFLIGHAKISDLLEAYEEGSHLATGDLGTSNGTPANGANGDTNGHKPTAARLRSTLVTLLIAGLIMPVHKEMFRSAEDIRNEIESRLLKEGGEYQGGAKGPKQKIALKNHVQDELEELRSERPSWVPDGNKRAFDHNANGTNGHNKRRRTTDAYDRDDGEEDLEEDEDIPLADGLIVYLNYEKFTVALRTEELVDLARARTGVITSQVYAELLKSLETNIPNCHADLGRDHGVQHTIRASKIYEAIPDTINVSLGIGKLGDKDEIDTTFLDQPQIDPKMPKIIVSDLTVEDASKLTGKANDGADGNDSDMEEDKPSINDLDMDGIIVGEQPAHDVRRGKGLQKVKGEPKPKGVLKMKGAQDAELSQANTLQVLPPNHHEVGSDDHLTDHITSGDHITSEDDIERRMEHLKNHLRVLIAEDAPFLRMCVYNEYIVDFPQLIRFMRDMELNFYLLETFGPEGHRLLRLLQQLGKMEEKQLPYIALMKQKDIRTKLAEMQMAGMVDIQGIPRDAGHTNARMIFLWHFDEDRVKAILLDKIYKAMSRHIQRLDIERRRASGIIALSQRSDVLSGRVALTDTQMKLLSEFRDKESKFIVQLARLDGLVAIFRDY